MAGAKWKVVEHWSKGLRGRLDDINKTTLKVGVTERSGAAVHPNGNGKTVGDIAFFNEYGTMTIPARSFIRDWVDGNIDKIAKQIGADTMRVLMAKESWEKALKQRGSVYRQEVLRRIHDGIPPPNAESTLAQKQGDTPLIDTTTLINAIVYEVSKK